MLSGILLAVLEAFFGCSKPRHDFVASPDAKAIVAGNNAFALDLYRQLEKREGNLAFSPFGVYTTLAMTYAGARGQTASETAKALHLTLPQSDVAPAFRQLLGWFESDRRPGEIQLALVNSLWARKEYRFKKDFLELIRTNFAGEGRSLDFTRGADAVSEINDWVQGKTGGNIKNIIGLDQMTADTRLFVCSAMYFDGKWRARFDVKNTSPMQFFVFPSNETLTVPMMFQFSRFKMTFGKVADDEQAIQILELPYSGADVSMIIFVPIVVELSAVEQNLTLTNLEKWLERLDDSKPEKLAVHLPRFRLEQNVDLASELKSLGIASLFDANADLSGMDGTTNLFVASAAHKAAIDVDEAGTKAMAATVVRTAAKGMPPQFMANKPFIFLIRDNQTHCILFIGRVVNPLKN